MHEYPITNEIIRIASETAKNKNAARVTKISIVAGDLCGYVSDSIQMYFDEISKGTVCEGAVLEINRVVPKLRCTSCGELFERKPFSFSCPVCNGEGEPTDIGKEFFIDYIQITD